MAGDSAVVAEFEPRIDPAVNDRVLAVAAAIRSAALPGVRDVVTTYRSVGIYFDPLVTSLEGLIETMACAPDRPIEGSASAPAPLEVPVRYGGAGGPDLAAVAAFGGCTQADVIALHSGVVYRVYMLGFVPGFAYMGNVDDRIAAPRRSTPRVRVPTGSVGIAGGQTGIYPAETPGGWNLIGWTDLKPFDVERGDPFLFKPGDRVRFVPV
ncbi:MAG: 5-oxoprolinase subunit PxpB [Acidobacteria bacterium]|nr:5-oxoprolinase subunit PxpB [Acidobacteriota bacterium]